MAYTVTSRMREAGILASLEEGGHSYDLAVRLREEHEVIQLLKKLVEEGRGWRIADERMRHALGKYPNSATKLDTKIIFGSNAEEATAP